MFALVLMNYLNAKLFVFILQQSGDMANLNGVLLSHPINIAQLFIPYASNPTEIKFDYKVTGLAKLLHFSNFMKTQSRNTMDYIAKEVNGYPYTKKSTLQVFSNVKEFDRKF